MDLSPLLAAVERGDDRTVLDFLDDQTRQQLSRDEAEALLIAAATYGRHQIFEHLADSDVTRPWADEVDPVMWAAERGLFWVLDAMLPRNGDPRSSDSPHRRALDTARTAMDSVVDVSTEVPPAHRAVITAMEAALGIRRSPDELMARAMVHADPRHDDWFASLVQLGLRADQDTFAWACSIAEDESSLTRRRFGLETLNFLGFGLDIDQEGEPPFAREAADFLRPRLETEQDAHALTTVIAAFTSYSPDEVRAIVAHAAHPDAGVRRTVASCLFLGPAASPADQQEILTALIRLASDPDPVTRTSALYEFTKSLVDGPELRAVLTERLADPQLEVRIEAAGALALRGDERGRAVLDDIRSGVTVLQGPVGGRLDDIYYRLRRLHDTADRGR